MASGSAHALAQGIAPLGREVGMVGQRFDERALLEMPIALWASVTESPA